MQIRRLTEVAPPASDYIDDEPTRQLVASAPNSPSPEPFEPFTITVETYKEAVNLGIVLRNHQRWTENAVSAPSLVALASKLHSIEGIDMNVYAE